MKTMYSSRLSYVVALALSWFTFVAASTAQTNTAEIDSLLKKFYNEGKFEGAVLVAEDGKVVYKGGFGLADRQSKELNQPHTIFRIASITKQFTAVLVMQLVESRALSLEGVITDYLPEYRSETGPKVSIHNLLTHTSGIPEFNCPNCSVLDTLKKSRTVDELVQRFGTGDLLFTPGSQFNYSNMDYVILGAIIERVVGKRWEIVLQEKIVKPIGLKSTGVHFIDPKHEHTAKGYLRQEGNYYPEPDLYGPNLHAAAAMYSTVEDLLKWSEALYARPCKLLSQHSLDLMFDQSNKPPFHLGYVGYSTWVYKIDLSGQMKLTLHERRGELGGFHSSIVRVVENNQVIILLSNVGTNDSVGTLYELSTGIIRFMNKPD